MAITRYAWLALAAIVVTLSAASPSLSRSQSLPAGDCDGRVARWDFAASSLSPAQQQNFRDAFCNEIVTIENWAANAKWSKPRDLPRFEIFVSDQYRLARSLVPAWEGNRGQLEFPAKRVVDGNASIAHELAHVYFPNGNRMLAEGFAVYLQDEVGGNPAFPNFGRNVHELIRCRAKAEIRQKFDLSGLDRIATPDQLTLQLADTLLTDGTTYVFASSFVRYLIDTHGMEKFRTLYARTPLEPRFRVARTSDDWSEVYQLSLPGLEQQWRSTIEGVICPS
jgi:hypothetical protein